MSDAPNIEALPASAVITLDRAAVERTAKGIRALQQLFENERDAWRRFDEEDDREAMQKDDEETIIFSHSRLTYFRENLAKCADVFENLVVQAKKFDDLMADHIAKTEGDER